jgi:tungstate transport system permease protein
VSEVDAGAVFEVALRTLLVCGSALFLASALGLPLGIFLGQRRFAGRGLAVSLVNAGMGAPPIVVGLLVALALWRTGPLGGLDLMYSLEAMVLAQTLIALPLVVGISLAAVGALGADWWIQVRALGISRLRELWLLVRGILSEVGAVSMVGGNLEGETRVLTTAILMSTQMGRFGEALAQAAVLLGLTLTFAAALTAIQQTGRQ